MSINEIVIDGENLSEQTAHLINRSSTVTSYKDFALSDEKEKESESSKA